MKYKRMMHRNLFVYAQYYIVPTASDPCTGALTLGTVNHKMHKIWSVEYQENY